jgi:hypothetical protein
MCTQRNLQSHPLQRGSQLAVHWNALCNGRVGQQNTAKLSSIIKTVRKRDKPENATQSHSNRNPKKQNHEVATNAGAHLFGGFLFLSFLYKTSKKERKCYFASVVGGGRFQRTWDLRYEEALPSFLHAGPSPMWLNEL